MTQLEKKQIKVFVKGIAMAPMLVLSIFNGVNKMYPSTFIIFEKNAIYGKIVWSSNPYMRW